ncbi:MAG: polysaccharide deacetylase family protein, partial [Bacteroidota bacterium]
MTSAHAVPTMTARLVRRLALCCLTLMLVALARPEAVRAQAISLDVELSHPAPVTANRLATLRDAGVAPVAVLNSKHTEDHVPGGEDFVDLAVESWEYLLLGLRMPYDILDDRELARGVPEGTRILVLPAAEALSGSQKRSVKRFLERGGGVIASGLVGFFTERGTVAETDFFEEVFGATFVPDLPPQPFGILQALDGGHPLTDGLPMAYRLNLTTQTPVGAVLPTTSTAVGRPFPYQPIDADVDPFQYLTMVLYGESMNGRVAWFRFNPQDVAREKEQQAVYQGMVVNAMAYVGKVVSMAVRPWPNGRQSATVMTALPLVGKGPEFVGGIRNTIDAFRRAQVTGSFFVTTDEASRHLSLVQELASVGDVGISSSSDFVLKKLPLNQQVERIQSAISALAGVGDNVIGIYPPGGFYDDNTLRAVQQTNLRYMLQPAPYESAAPNFVDRFLRADFREPLDEIVFRQPERQFTGYGELQTNAADVNRTVEWEERVGYYGDYTSADNVEFVELPDPVGNRYFERSDNALDRTRRVRVNRSPDRRMSRMPYRQPDDTMAVAMAEVPINMMPSRMTLADREAARRARMRMDENVNVYEEEGVLTDNPNPGVPSWRAERNQLLSTGRVLGEDYNFTRIRRDPRLNVAENQLRDEETMRMMGNVDGSMSEGSIDDRAWMQQPLLFSITGRDDYAVITVEGLEGSPEAQLGAYQRDFTDIHNAAGLYILPYHFEIQGLTPERADVLAALGRYADRSGSWVTTLAEIHDWWTKRAQLEVRIGARSERATAFEVI